MGASCFHDGKREPLPNALTEGPLPAAVWQMSFPLLFTYFVSSAIGMVDTYLAGFLGATAQAAVGLADQVIFLTVMAGTGVCVAVVALVSRALGQGDSEKACLYARDSLALCVVLGGAAALAGVLLSDSIFAVLGGDELSAIGARYLKLCSLGNLPFIVAMCLSAIFRAYGRPQYSLYLWGAMSAVSITLALAWFYGWLPGARLSVDAFSMSWVCGSLSGACLGMAWLPRVISADARRLLSFEPSVSLAHMGELAILGFPAVLAEVIWVGSNFGIYTVLAWLPSPEAARAAWTIALKVDETIAFPPIAAVAMAIATIVGQNLGAGHKERAWQATRCASAVMGVLMLLVSFLIYLAAEPLAEAFAHFGPANAYAALLIRTAPLTVPTMAVSLILLAALEGAGKTAVPMVLNALACLVLRVPLVALSVLCGGCGVAGLAYAWSFSRLVLAIVSGAAFARTFARL